jgi:hypothetical protein
MMRRLDVWWGGRIVGMLRVRAGTGRWHAAGGGETRGVNQPKKYQE